MDKSKAKRRTKRNLKDSERQGECQEKEKEEKDKRLCLREGKRRQWVRGRRKNAKRRK